MRAVLAFITSAALTAGIALVAQEAHAGGRVVFGRSATLGVAVDGSGGQAVPLVTTSAATSVSQTEATLNGSADPNGAASTGYFRYSTTDPGTCNNTFGTRAPASGGDALGGGSAAVSFSETLTGLTPSTTYYFCAVASNSGGAGVGAVQSFTTSALVTSNGYAFVDTVDADGAGAGNIWHPYVVTDLSALTQDCTTVAYLLARPAANGGDATNTAGTIGGFGPGSSSFAFRVSHPYGGWDTYPYINGVQQPQILLAVPFPGTPTDAYSWYFARVNQTAGQMRLDIVPAASSGIAPQSSGVQSIPTSGWPARSNWTWFVNPREFRYSNDFSFAAAFLIDGCYSDAQIVAQATTSATRQRKPIVPSCSTSAPPCIYYEMDLDTDGFAQDISGNGRHGVLTGSAPAQSSIVPTLPYIAP